MAFIDPHGAMKAFVYPTPEPPQEPARMPLAKAAKQLKVSRASIYRWAKEGRFSVTVGPDGQKLVDMAELARVFPEIASRQLNQDIKRQAKDAEETAENGTDPLLIQVELHATREALRLTQEQLTEAKEREHRLLGIVESQTRLLEHKPEPQEPAQTGIATWIGVLAVVAMFALVAAFTYF